MSTKTFSRANRLWFHEGRTAKALAAYRQARQAAPTDPVVAFQLARVSWSLDRFDDARFLLEQAHVFRDQLNDRGRKELDHWRERLAGRPPERGFPELAPEGLDRDRLESGPLPVRDWRTVADAADAREMHGLAVYALDRWGGAPIDAEDAREIGEIESRRDAEEAVLARMRAAARPPSRPAGARGPARPGPPRDRPGPSAPRAPRRAVSAPPTGGPAAAPRVPELPSLPLTLEVRATPVEGPVNAPTELVATLGNAADRALVVNRRMLLNHVGGPGEIWLDVRGPEGHRNTIGFRVRAGEAGNELFVSLAPGKTVEQSWTLNDYQSLQTPGDYVVTLTYHNEAARAPDGRPMAVGKAAGSACFHRHA